MRSSERDYEWARDQMAQRGLENVSRVLFSPAHGVLDAARLADWILRDRLPVRMQVQLHKYLWGDEPGR
jgi:7-carboxy-7-deazaguanine synthase